MLDSPNSKTVKGMYVGGNWIAGQTSFDDINPSDGSLYARIPDGGRAETRMQIGLRAVGIEVLGVNTPI